MPLALYVCKSPFAREREREKFEGESELIWLYLSVMALEGGKTIEESRTG